MTVYKQATPYLESGYSWTECPRWHDGRLYFSDLFNARVMVSSSLGQAEVFADLSGREGVDGKRVVVAGIDFLPDNRLLVNSMLERLTLCWDGTASSVYADLRGLTDAPINDMVVDSAGRAYVSQLGYDLFAGEEARESHLLLVDIDGSARIVEEAGTLRGPNGMAISADGATLYVAEADAKRITAFDRSESGALSRRRVHVDLKGITDGICADEQGAIWASQPIDGAVVRVLKSGEIAERIVVDRTQAGVVVACVLGGTDRRTLFLCCGFEVMDFDKSVREARGSIWSAGVDTSGDGCRP